MREKGAREREAMRRKGSGRLGEQLNTTYVALVFVFELVKTRFSFLLGCIRQRFVRSRGLRRAAGAAAAHHTSANAPKLICFK